MIANKIFVEFEDGHSIVFYTYADRNIVEKLITHKIDKMSIQQVDHAGLHINVERNIGEEHLVHNRSTVRSVDLHPDLWKARS